MRFQSSSSTPAGARLRSARGRPSRARAVRLGTTDATGTAAHNQELSAARATAVRDYLAAHSIAGARLRAAGFGATRPVADNSTDLGRARNRRVELVRE